jgi:hypothetical protein
MLSENAPNDEQIKFVISLTTLPNRNKNLFENITSLLNQNYENFEVHLNVPKTTERNGDWCDTTTNGPDIPKNNEKLKVFWVDDVGAITNLIYTVKRTTDRVIIVNDDFVYNPDMLREYNTAVKELPDAVIGFNGIYPVGAKTDGDLSLSAFTACVKKPTRVGLLESYKSICYDPAWIGEDFFTEWYGKHYNDDLLIGSYLGYKGIHKYVIPWSNETVFDIRMLSFPCVKPLANCISGVEHDRRAEGGSCVSYKKFYNSELGKYLKV